MYRAAPERPESGTGCRRKTNRMVCLGSPALTCKLPTHTPFQNAAPLSPIVGWAAVRGSPSRRERGSHWDRYYINSASKLKLDLPFQPNSHYKPYLLKVSGNQELRGTGAGVVWGCHPGPAEQAAGRVWFWRGYRQAIWMLGGPSMPAATFQC